MSNPTTPFSWQMPTATDLVTDLPADFEVFGQAVATSMADLLGGTSGQILAKNSNTDMDFVWVANDVGDITAVTAGTGISGGGTSGAVTITNSMATEITAKGDLIVGTGSATFDNLAAGANGSTLVTDSTATTGLRYSATPSASNPILNSAMQVWQRGTSIALTASTPAYTTDRWYLTNGANAASTVSRQVTGDTTNLPNIQYCARVQRNSGQTGTSALHFTQPIETINSIPFVGKTVTYSFYARAGANYSPASSALTAYLIGGTGTDQQVLGFTGASVIIGSTATLTTTWQRFSYSATVATSVTQLGARFDCTPVGTAGTNDYYEITGVQIDIGSVALPFRTYAATIQNELAACQRYYQRITPTGSGQNYGVGFIGGGLGDANLQMEFPVEMRTRPTALEQSGTATDYTILNSSGATACNAVPTFVASTTYAMRVNLTTAGVFTASSCAIGRSANSNAYLGWSAEL